MAIIIIVRFIQNHDYLVERKSIYKILCEYSHAVTKAIESVILMLKEKNASSKIIAYIREDNVRSQSLFR